MIIIYQMRSYCVDSLNIVLVVYLNIILGTDSDMYCPFLYFHNLSLLAGRTVKTMFCLIVMIRIITPKTEGRNVDPEVF